VKHALALCLLAAACAPPRSGITAPPRNLVLVVVDTLRADHTGPGGYHERTGRDTTPFLDELAAREDVFVFPRAYSSSPWTKPSVATLLTGLDPRAHGVTLHHERLHSDHWTLAEHLQSLGFQTAAFQSNMLLAAAFGYDQGFETWGEDNLATHDTSTGDAVNADAIRWLREERDPERPLFLYVHHYEPHFTYLESGERWYPDYPGPLTGLEPMDELIGARHQLRDEEVRFLESRYDAEILQQDGQLRDLWEALEATGELDETLVVFTADHGEEFMEHGDLSHEFKLYEELVHVPLMVFDPRGANSTLLSSGLDLEAPISATDLPATLLDLLADDVLRHELEASGYAAPFPGISALTGGSRPGPRRPLAHSSYLDHEGVERGRDSLLEPPFKLIRQEAGAGFEARLELYDLSKDPGEQHDLAAERPDLVEALLERLEKELARRLSDGPGAELPAEYVDLSPEDIAKLKALGYL